MKHQLKTLKIAFIFVYTAISIFISYQLLAVDTSDWFAPTNAPLEVHHNGTGQTVNPQLTVDGKQLQGGE